MTQLDEHLDRVEKYGFNRDLFPQEYKGHRIGILKNDAHICDDGRLSYHITAYCQWCGLESSFSGRFPAHDNNQIEHIIGVKFAVFGRFIENEC